MAAGSSVAAVRDSHRSGTVSALDRLAEYLATAG
jgi:hypothetical protein